MATSWPRHWIPIPSGSNAPEEEEEEEKQQQQQQQEQEEEEKKEEKEEEEEEEEEEEDDEAGGGRGGGASSARATQNMGTRGSVMVPIPSRLQHRSKVVERQFDTFSVSLSLPPL